MINRIAIILGSIFMLFSCTTHHYHKVDNDNEPVSPYSVVIQFSNVSDDEYAFIINKTKEVSDITLDSEWENESYRFVEYYSNTLNGINTLRVKLESLKAIYGEDSEMTNILTPSLNFRHFTFSRIIDSGTSAQYKIRVTFDPNSEVSIGGVILFTDNDGLAEFKGDKLDLSNLSEGIVYIISGTKKAKVSQSEDGNWYVYAKGYSLGKEAEKVIELEELK